MVEHERLVTSTTWSLHTMCQLQHHPDSQKPILFYPPLISHTTPHSKCYRSELAGSSLSSTVGVSSVLHWKETKWKPESHKAHRHLCYNSNLPHSLPNSHPPMPWMTVSSQAFPSGQMGGFFYKEFHQSACLRVSVSGTCCTCVHVFCV